MEGVVLAPAAAEEEEEEPEDLTVKRSEVAVEVAREGYRRERPAAARWDDRWSSSGGRVEKPIPPPDRHTLEVVAVEEARNGFDPRATVEQHSVAAWLRSVHPTVSSVVAVAEGELRSTKPTGVAAVDLHGHTSQHRPTAAVR